MKKTVGPFDFPPWYINEYLLDIFKEYDINIASSDSNTEYKPFVAAGVVSNLDEYYQQLSYRSSGSESDTTDFSGMLPATIFYDRMIRLRTSPFYIGKREQTLYTVYGRVEDAHKIGMIISRVLDREDVSAQDLNKWINENRSWITAPISQVVNGKTGLGLPASIFFRNMRVFQVDESRDLVELNTYRGATMHKYIVEYDYHFKDNPEFL